jgi:hypothetical protein
MPEFHKMSAVKSLWRRLAKALRLRATLWRSWRRLLAADRGDFVRVVCLIPAISLTLRLFGMARTYRWLDASARGAAREAEDAQVIETALVTALIRARRYAPYRGNCLSQSLSLWWLCRRQGLDVTLRLGVRIDDRVFSAHAWVERSDRSINDTADVRERFTPFAPHPSSGAHLVVSRRSR